MGGHNFGRGGGALDIVNKGAGRKSKKNHGGGRKRGLDDHKAFAIKNARFRSICPGGGGGLLT